MTDPKAGDPEYEDNIEHYCLVDGKRVEATGLVSITLFRAGDVWPPYRGLPDNIDDMIGMEP